MATFVSGLYVGTFGGRTLNINVTGNISRNGTTVTLSSISCYLYSTDGGTWYAASPRTWGLRAPDGTAVSTSVPYSPYANSRTFSLSNLSFYLANSATSCTMYVTGPDGSFAFTLSGIPQGYVAPSGLSVSIASIGQNNATFNVSLSSYGTPSSTDGRYIEAAILGGTSYGNPYRYAIARNTNSATISVSNSSNTGSTALTILPNTTYRYGGYATNTQLSTSTVSGSFTTLPASITDVVVTDLGNHEYYLSVQHGTEGTASTVYTEYSYNQSDWNTVQSDFRLTIITQTTIYIRRTNSTGSTPVYMLSISPTSNVGMYAPVNDKSVKVKKMYASINNESVRVVKAYASVKGKSKLVFAED